MELRDGVGSLLDVPWLGCWASTGGMWFRIDVLQVSISVKKAAGALEPQPHSFELKCAACQC